MPSPASAAFVSERVTPYPCLLASAEASRSMTITFGRDASGAAWSAAARAKPEMPPPAITTVSSGPRRFDGLRPELEEARVDGARTADVAGAEGDFGGGEDDVDVPLVAAPSVSTPGRSRLCRPPIALEPHATTRGAATAGGRRCAFAPGEARRSSRGLKKDDVSVCRGLVATIFSGHAFLG